MSDIHWGTNRKNRKFQCRIWFSYILFSVLIVFDIFAVLNAVQPLLPEDPNMDLGSLNNSSKVETWNHTPEEEVVIGLMVKEFKEFHADNISLDLMAKMEVYLDWVALAVAQESKEVTMVTLEVLAIVILLLFNLVALLGLNRRQACLLVPWMIVYFTGFCASYFRALVLLIEQVNEKEEDGSSITSIFYPLGTAIIFTLAWIFVFTIFKELIRNQQEEDRPWPIRV